MESVELKTSETKGKRTRVWAISSGKGGVGKSFISTSLAIALTKLGHQVLVVDLDPSGANVHTALGEDPSTLNLRHWLDGERSLPELVTPTKIPHLSFIQGLWDNWCPRTLSASRVREFVEEVRQLRTDIILLDLGPGATDSQLEIFNCADERLLVTTPEPTSIEKTYRFIESEICYRLRDSARPESFASLLKALQEHRARRQKGFFSFRGYLQKHEGFEIDHFERLNEKPLRLIVNMSRSQSNANLGHSMKSVCNKFYDLQIDYAGAIDYDNAVWQSVRKGEPALIAQPFTSIAGQFLTICKHLIAPEEIRAVG